MMEELTPDQALCALLVMLALKKSENGAKALANLATAISSLIVTIAKPGQSPRLAQETANHILDLVNQQPNLPEGPTFVMQTVGEC